MNDFLDVRREAQVEQLSARLAFAQTDEEFEDIVRGLAEESGAKPETLSVALRLIREHGKERSWLGRLRRQISLMDLTTKRIVASAFLGLQSALVAIAGAVFGDMYGVGAILQLVIIVAAIYNLALAKTANLGILTGATFGGAYVAGLSMFSLLMRSPNAVEGWLIVPAILIGAAVGAAVGALGENILQIRFRHDPEKRREMLLRQLVELQEELKQGERIVTFLSVDVVGSTRIKGSTDQFSAEYSFGEYTNYVTEIAAKFGGTVHSTAGDGVLLVFDHPMEAFQAARRVQAGMLEFNSYRNRTGSPFELRCGLHTGPVVAPGGDLSSVSHSHVIDLSAHIQKAAPPGGIAVSEDAAVFLPGGATTVGEESVEIQGVRGYIWRSSARPEAIKTQVELPPLPNA